MLAASVVAALFWNTASVYLQKKWRVYDVFVGKKHALLVHGLLISIVWVQVIVVSVFVPKSTWSFRPYVFFGLIMAAASLYIFILAIKDIGYGSLINSNFFGRKLKTTGQLFAKIKHPMYIAMVTLYLALGLIFGQNGYWLAAICLFVGLSLLAYVEKPKISTNIHKHK